MDGGDETQAISVWLQAAEAARAGGDFDAVAELRDRISVLDPEAANSLGPPPEPAARPVAPEVEPTVVNFDAVEPAEAEDPNELSREIDLDDIEIDIEDSEFAEEIPTPGTDDGEDDPAAAESIEIETDRDDDATPPEPIAAEAGAADSSAGISAASVQKIAEDIEEADFYMKQGLADEAEAIYRRVLSVAPNHPLALVRLGEVAALRGDDPASSHPGLEIAAAAPVDASAEGSVEAAEATSFREDIPGPDDGDFAAPERSSGFEADDAAGAPPVEAAAASDFELDVDVDVEFESYLEGATSDEGDGAALEREAVSPEVEEDLASQFLTEVTEPVGFDLAAEDAAGAEAERDAEPPDADDTASVGTAARGFAAAEEADAGGLPGLDAEVAADAPAKSAEDEAAPDLVSPDDSYTDAGVALGDGPELTLPEDADDSTDADADGASFDLAAELSDVFDDEDGDSASGLGDSGDGFEAVFREFKRGVSLTLSETDHAAHFDLGIAYREMGLFEDAKNEFRAAMLNPDREIECRHMLGLCYLEQQSPAEAVGEFERIVAFDGASDEQRLSARFELGRAYVVMGEKERARTAFEAVAAVDAGFCDVREHLEDLDAPEPVASPSLESFDDLIADVEDGGDETAEAASGYETFDDLMGDESDAADAEEPEVGDAVAAVEEVEDFDEVEPEPTPEPPTPRKRKKISFV